MNWKWVALAPCAIVFFACGGSPFTIAPGDAGGGTGGPSGGSSPDASPGGSAHGGGVDASTSGGDAGGDGASSPACGPLTCSAAQTCCVYTTGTGQATYDCLASCPPPSNGHVSSLLCTSAADCAPGAVCCIERVGNDNQSACAPACTSNQGQLCDPSSPANDCAANAPCSTNNIADWGLPATFGTCGGVSVP